MRWLANNLPATVDSTGKLTITTTERLRFVHWSAAIGGAIGGTLASVATFTTAPAPVVDVIGADRPAATW